MPPNSGSAITLAQWQPSDQGSASALARSWFRARQSCVSRPSRRDDYSSPPPHPARDPLVIARACGALDLLRRSAREIALATSPADQPTDRSNMNGADLSNDLRHQPGGRCGMPRLGKQQLASSAPCRCRTINCCADNAKPCPRTSCRPTIPCDHSDKEQPRMPSFGNTIRPPGGLAAAGSVSKSYPITVRMCTSRNPRTSQLRRRRELFYVPGCYVWHAEWHILGCLLVRYKPDDSATGAARSTPYSFTLRSTQSCSTTADPVQGT